MKSTALAALVLAGLSGLANAEVISFDVTAPASSTSTIGSNGRTITAAVDGAGLSNDAIFLDKTHSPTANFQYWLSAINAVTSGNEQLIFRFASASDVAGVAIWNYYNANTDWNKRGLKSFDLSFSFDPTSTPFGDVTFGEPIPLPTNIAIGSLNAGGRVDVQTVAFAPQSNVTFVRLSNLTNHATSVAVNGQTNYFGLNEIRFIPTPEPATGVLAALALSLGLLRRRG